MSGYILQVSGPTSSGRRCPGHPPSGGVVMVSIFLSRSYAALTFCCPLGQLAPRNTDSCCSQLSPLLQSSMVAGYLSPNYGSTYKFFFKYGQKAQQNCFLSTITCTALVYLVVAQSTLHMVSICMLSITCCVNVDMKYFLFINQHGGPIKHRLMVR